MKKLGIVWFRNDLRLHDNEALVEAIQHCYEIIPVYIFDEQMLHGETEYGFSKSNDNRLQFYMNCVEDLGQEIETRGGSLLVQIGDPADILYRLTLEFKADYVFCNRERTPYEMSVQDEVEQRLWSIGREIRFSRGKMLIHTADLPFPVTHVPDSYYLFHKEVSYIPVRQPFVTPESIRTPAFKLWSSSWPELSAGSTSGVAFEGGSTAVLDLLNVGISSSLSVSPWLASGALSSKYYYYAIRDDAGLSGDTQQALIQRLYMRDHLRFMVKKYGSRIFRSVGLKPGLNSEPHNHDVIQQFIHGSTGERLIDAGIRQLKTTGWISYDMRLLMANYFIYHLRQNWYIGAQVL